MVFADIRTLKVQSSTSTNQLEKLCHYIDRQWLRKATIGPDRLSVHGSHSRTDNVMESYILSWAFAWPKSRPIRFSGASAANDQRCHDRRRSCWQRTSNMAGNTLRRQRQTNQTKHGVIGYRHIYAYAILASSQPQHVPTHRGITSSAFSQHSFERRRRC